MTACFQFVSARTSHSAFVSVADAFPCQKRYVLSVPAAQQDHTLIRAIGLGVVHAIEVGPDVARECTPLLEWPFLDVRLAEYDVARKREQEAKAAEEKAARELEEAKRRAEAERQETAARKVRDRHSVSAGFEEEVPPAPRGSSGRKPADPPLPSSDKEDGEHNTKSKPKVRRLPFLYSIVANLGEFCRSLVW